MSSKKKTKRSPISWLFSHALKFASPDHLFNTLHPVLLWCYVPTVVLFAMSFEPQPSFKDLINILE